MPIVFIVPIVGYDTTAGNELGCLPEVFIFGTKGSMQRIAPRVLIVGVTFNESSGSGITLKNLFTQYPKDHLAVIGCEDVTRLSNLSLCPRVYQLGQQERRVLFPFSLLVRNRPYSGPLKQGQELKLQTILSNKIGWYGLLYSAVINTLNLLGIRLITKRYVISEQLDDWIRQFQPDIVYSQHASLSMMRLVASIAKKYQLPTVLHVMDNWPAFINKPNLFYHYWQRIIDSEFRLAVAKAALLFGVSDGMRTEYQKKYHRDFKPFHNPIDTKKWLRHQKKDWAIQGIVKIIYLGAININNNTALREISEAVDALNRQGHNFAFDIYSFQRHTRVASILYGYQGVTLREPVAHHLIPELVSRYDFNLLALNGNKKSIKYTSLSLSTKASEYMASGVPTIVYAPRETEYNAHASKHGWAHVISVRNKKAIMDSLMDIVSNGEMRKGIAKRAMRYAEQKCDIDRVSQDFYAEFTNLMGVLSRKK